MNYPCGRLKLMIVSNDDNINETKHCFISEIIPNHKRNLITS